MKFNLRLGNLLLILFLGGLCSCNIVSLPKSASSSEPEGVARKEFEQYFTKCGDSYYRRAQLPNYTPLFEVTQYQDVRFVTTSEPLDNADKLNGVEWKGIVEINCKVKRAYREWNGGFRPWSDWEPCALPMSGNVPIATLQLVKRQGQWKQTNKPTSQSPPKPIQCDELRG